MTTENPPPPPPPGPPPAGRWRSVASDVADGARRSAPHLKRAAGQVGDGVIAAIPVVKRGAGRLGDWLATVGWGKFLLLSLLLLIFGGIASSVLFERSAAIVIEPNSSPSDRVNVSVSVSPEGIRVTPATPPSPPRPPAAPGVPRPPATPDSAAGGPAVSIDERGVRIYAERDGKKVAIQIDGNGVRIDEMAAGAGQITRDAEGIVIPPSVVEDPAKLEQALETAREKIEEIVNAQVDRQVARQTRVYREQTDDWFMSFLVLLILTGIIVKIVLGSKKKAEVRAQAATATAAEEGLKRQLAEAQLKMMQAQVEPHFLFNTLASVDYLIETDPARASTMQKNLIQYLRAALPQMREGSTTLGKELALCRSYLEILKVRMEDRLQFAITVPQGLASAQFPPMMLQSLVENAIKHGLEPKAEGGTLTLSADISHGTLRVTVADTGLGFGAAGTAGTGVGLANVRERLAALYGGTAKLAVQANTPSGTIATIEVPYVLEGSSARGAGPAGAAPQPA